MDKQAAFEADVERHLAHGYRIQWRDDSRVQLVKPKNFKLGWAAFWLLLGFILGFFLGIRWLLLGFVGLGLYILSYLAAKDKTLYLDLDHWPAAIGQRAFYVPETEAAIRHERNRKGLFLSLAGVALGALIAAFDLLSPGLNADLRAIGVAISIVSAALAAGFYAQDLDLMSGA